MGAGEELRSGILAGEIDIEEHVESVLKELHSLDRRYSCMSAVSAELAQSQALALAAKVKKGEAKDLPLLGTAVSFKDAICVRGVQSAASSGILAGYRPVFQSTVAQRVADAGGIIIGKTTQDEFGFGSFAVNVGKGFTVPKNPHDETRCCGGSSGGAAALTAVATFSHIGIAESTGGSIAAPASFCGVSGLCPTYGLVSRYGLIDYGNSLDKIGPMARSTLNAARMLSVIAGFDEHDATSLQEKRRIYSINPPGAKKLEIGVVRETLGEGVDSEVRDAVWAAVKALESEGISYKEVSLPLTAEYGLATYYIIAVSEASTNLARYCGMRYGHQEKIQGDFNAYFSKIRDTAFGKEAKRRVMLGTFARMAGFRDAYYLRALKVRSRIIAEYKSAFKGCDALVSPSMPVTAPRFDEIERLKPLQHYMMDVLLVGPNLAGLPHLSVPAGNDQKGMPIGTLLIGDHLQEETLLSLGAVLERGEGR